MSVLTEIVHNRAGWGQKYFSESRKTRQVRDVLEYVLIVCIGFVIYCYHTQLLEVATSIFQ
jgi:hypothetical protein